MILLVLFSLLASAGGQTPNRTAESRSASSRPYPLLASHATSECCVGERPIVALRLEASLTSGACENDEVSGDYVRSDVADSSYYGNKTRWYRVDRPWVWIRWSSYEQEWVVDDDNRDEEVIAFSYMHGSRSARPVGTGACDDPGCVVAASWLEGRHCVNMAPATVSATPLDRCLEYDGCTSVFRTMVESPADIPCHPAGCTDSQCCDTSVGGVVVLVVFFGTCFAMCVRSRPPTATRTETPKEERPPRASPHRNARELPRAYASAPSHHVECPVSRNPLTALFNTWSRPSLVVKVKPRIESLQVPDLILGLAC